MEGAGEAVEIRRIAPGTAEYAASLDLRDRVMYMPLGFAAGYTERADAQIDEGTPAEDRLHLGAFIGAELVGYARANVSDESARLYQVSVDPPAQRSGVGRALMAATEDELRERGVVEVGFAAREEALGFYLGLGYEVVGERFRSERTGTPHFPMSKRL